MGVEQRSTNRFEARLAQVRTLEGKIRAHIRVVMGDLDTEDKSAYTTVMTTPPAFLSQELPNVTERQEALSRTAHVTQIETEQTLLLALIRTIGVSCVQANLRPLDIIIALDNYEIPTKKALIQSFSQDRALFEEAIEKGKEAGITQLLAFLLPSSNLTVKRQPVRGDPNSWDVSTAVEGVKIRYKKDPGSDNLTRELIILPLR